MSQITKIFDGSIGPSSGFVSGNVTTVDDTPTTIITFPLGAVPRTYTITGAITAFDVTDTAGAGYSFSGAYRTTGVAGTEINTQTGDIFEEAAMAAAGFDLLVVGNNLIVQVTGIGVGLGGKTINWFAEFRFDLVG
jgi:hypothetical protein